MCKWQLPNILIMDNFDLRKYLAENKLLKEEIDFPELEDEFEGAMDAMVVEPEVYLQDIIDASAEEIVSDDYYEIMNAVEQGVYSAEEAVKLAKAWAKDKLSSLEENKLIKETKEEDYYNLLMDLKGTELDWVTERRFEDMMLKRGLYNSFEDFLDDEIDFFQEEGNVEIINKIKSTFLNENKLLKEYLDLEIDEDQVTINSYSGEYSGFIEDDGTVDFSVTGYEEEREDGEIDFDEDNWKDILGPKHAFVKISNQIPTTKVEAAGDYVMITVDLEDLKAIAD